VAKPVGVSSSVSIETKTSVQVSPGIFRLGYETSAILS
jgi:hypothetical protein